MQIIRRHLTTNISGILQQDDIFLSKFFGMPAKEAREQLEELKAKGYKYVPNHNCDGFDPVKGCPGHKI